MTRQVLHYPEFCCDVCGHTSFGITTGDKVKASTKPPARWIEAGSDKKPSKRRHYCSQSCLEQSEDYDDVMGVALDICHQNLWPLPEEVIRWYGADWAESYEQYRSMTCRSEDDDRSAVNSETSPSTAGSVDSVSRERLPKSGRLVGFIFAIKE